MVGGCVEVRRFKWTAIVLEGFRAFRSIYQCRLRGNSFRDSRTLNNIVPGTGAGGPIVPRLMYASNITQVRGGATPLTLYLRIYRPRSLHAAFHYQMLYYLGNRHVTFRPNTNLLSIITNQGYDTLQNLNATRRNWRLGLQFVGIAVATFIRIN